MPAYSVGRTVCDPEVPVETNSVSARLRPETPELTPPPEGGIPCHPVVFSEIVVRQRHSDVSPLSRAQEDPAPAEQTLVAPPSKEEARSVTAGDGLDRPHRVQRHQCIPPPMGGCDDGRVGRRDSTASGLEGHKDESSWPPGRADMDPRPGHPDVDGVGPSGPTGKHRVGDGRRAVAAVGGDGEGGHEEEGLPVGVECQQARRPHTPGRGGQPGGCQGPSGPHHHHHHPPLPPAAPPPIGGGKFTPSVIVGTCVADREVEDVPTATPSQKRRRTRNHKGRSVRRKVGLYRQLDEVVGALPYRIDGGGVGVRGGLPGRGTGAGGRGGRPRVDLSLPVSFPQKAGTVMYDKVRELASELPSDIQLELDDALSWTERLRFRDDVPMDKRRNRPGKVSEGVPWRVVLEGVRAGVFALRPCRFCVSCLSYNERQGPTSVYF